MMSESVGSREIIFSRTGCHCTDDFFQNRIVRESEENGLDIRIIDTDMLHAVLFLVAAGKLMLLDAALHVIVDISSHNQTVLCAAVHCLGVYIIMLLVVLHEPSVFLERLESVGGALIYSGVMLIGARLEIDFRLDDVI